MGVVVELERKDERFYKGVELLPLGPFRAWLIGRQRERYHGNKQLLADACGINERRATVYLTAVDSVRAAKANGVKGVHRPKTHVLLDVVDAAVLCEGSAYLWELYPSLYADCGGHDLLGDEDVDTSDCPECRELKRYLRWFEERVTPADLPASVLEEAA